MLLSNRRHQLNYEQALQSYCPVSSGFIQCTLSGHTLFGETVIINCFFKMCLCILISFKEGGQSLSISWLSYSNIGPCNASGTRSAYPTFTRVANIRSPGTPKIGASPQRPDTEHMSSYRFRYTPRPMQCQWNKVRLSHHHQGSQHLTPQDGMSTEQRHMSKWQQLNGRNQAQKVTIKSTGQNHWKCINKN